MVHRVTGDASAGNLGIADPAQLASQPSPPLLATISLTIVVIAVLLPFTPLESWFGFVPPSVALLLAIAGLTASYLLLAESAKQAFYRVRSSTGIAPPRPTATSPAADRVKYDLIVVSAGGP